MPEAPRSPTPILSAGIASGLGHGRELHALAIGEGATAFADSEAIRHGSGAPMVLARADWLAESARLETRLRALATAALDEVLRAFDPDLLSQRAPSAVHLALSQESGADRLADAVCEEIQRSFPEWLSRAHIEVHVEGNTAGLVALEAACAATRRDPASPVLVGAVHSWIDPDVLRALDRDQRVHGAGQKWGMIPGEGAAFLMLGSPRAASLIGGLPLASVTGVGLGREDKLLDTSSVCVGEGLTDAFRQVLSDKHPVETSYCDLNGEPYRADEYAFAATRTGAGFMDAGQFEAPAQNWGDVGAASGLMALCLGIEDVAQARASRVAIWSSSARLPCRGMAVIGAPR